MAGLRAAIAHEESFRLELLIFLVMAPLGIWLGESSVERVLLVGTLVLVILVELLNTAIEKSSIVSAGITMTFPGTPKTWARLPC
jgi:diacylglycerol kinase (ATP)